MNLNANEYRFEPGPYSPKREADYAYVKQVAKFSVTMKENLKQIASLGWLAFGVSVSCLLIRILPLISIDHLVLYHFDGFPKALFLPEVLDILALWILLTSLLVATPAGRLAGMLWTAIFLLLPWILIRVWVEVLDLAIPHSLSLTMVLCPLLCVAALGLFWEYRLRQKFDRFLPAMQAFLSFCSLNGLVIMALFSFCWWKARHVNELPPLHRRASETRPKGPSRVIIILLDELSYDQVYGHRSPDLALPAFDSWASTSTIFGNVRPAARQTDRAVPSLLTGSKVIEIRASVDGRTLLMQSGDSWVKFNPQDTVFGDALRSGYSTGLAGWYNPYCRLLPQVLDRCFWTASNDLPAMLMVDSNSVSANTLEPALRLAHAIPMFFRRDQTSLSRSAIIEHRQHITDYQRLFAAADSLLLDSTTNFVFLHLPIPHPYGIYDRKKHRLAANPTSYVDNLALADEYLAYVQQLLWSKDEWDSSAIVVTGDHSWRPWLWIGNSARTKEEDVAAVKRSGGFDDRPGLIVKLPYQSSGNHIDTAFEATRFRGLIDCILTGQVKTSSDLKTWVEPVAR